MSKIICDVCGTSFPDASSQCPICGSVRQAVADNNFSDFDEADAAGYAYVKGGRFSKSNVRKRVKNTPVEDIDEYGSPENLETENKKTDTPLVVTAIILLLAVAAVVVFITIRFFGPGAQQNDEDVYSKTQTTAQETTDDGLIECTKLDVSSYEIEIPAGGTYELKVIKEPASTTDIVTYKSSDESIAIVDENGLITPVSTGSTVIVITCGTQEIEVRVSCTVEEEIPFVLDNFEIKLDYAGKEWILYSGDVPHDEITYSSDDETVATFADGVVCAVGPGTTIVSAQYGDIVVTCTVTCEFEETQTGDDSGITEDGKPEDGKTEGDTGSGSEETIDSSPKATGTKGYKIRTQFGDAYGSSPEFDVSHILEGVLYFKLVDAYGNRVSATWKIYNTSICTLSIDDGVAVTCLAEGTAYLVATTEDGETYVCTIRVS